MIYDIINNQKKTAGVSFTDKEACRSILLVPAERKWQKGFCKKLQERFENSFAGKIKGV